MLLTSTTFLLVISTWFAMGIDQKPHKVRHKHNTLIKTRIDRHKLDDIRNAFDELRNVMPHSKSSITYKNDEKLPNFDDYYYDEENDDDSYYDDDNSLEINNYDRNRKSLSKSAKSNYHNNVERLLRQKENFDGLRSEHFIRHKRPDISKKFTTPTTSTRKPTPKTFINDHDESYFDDDADPLEKPLSDDAHAHAPVQQQQNRRHYRESSNSNYNQNQDHQDSSGSLTEHKWSEYGNRDGVDKNFHSYTSKQKKELAAQHLKRFRIDSKCQKPHIKVLDAPYHASKRYIPNKYVVFRCSDDTACCVSEAETCVAKHSQDVDFWFQTYQIRNNNKKIDDHDLYEKLTVSNHTECHCVNKRDHRNRMTTTEKTTTLKSPESCKCPSHFIAETDDEGACHCTCPSTIEININSCQMRYEGNEGFSLTDRSCIQRQQCAIPQCLYGDYKKLEGRCPQSHRSDKVNKGINNRWGRR